MRGIAGTRSPGETALCSGKNRGDAQEIIVQSRIRYYKEKSECSGIEDRTKEKEAVRHVRNVFLTWLSKGLENKTHCGKTEDGRVFLHM